jgi:hypothetical protein
MHTDGFRFQGVSHQARRRERRRRRGSKKLWKGRRPGLCLEGNKPTGCHKKRMMTIACLKSLCAIMFL